MRESDAWRTIARFARAHDVRGVLVAFALIAVCDAIFGSTVLQLPYTGGEAGVPFRRELPLAFASVAAASLSSPMRRFEETAAAAFRAAQHAWLGGVVTSAAVVLTVEELIISPPATAVILLRALLVWTGIALLSGRVFGWRLSFILPMASVFPLTYWQYDGQGRNRWWDWTHQPPMSLGCWAIAGAALAAGSLAVAVTPWRAARGRAHLAAALGRTRTVSPR
ncbi:hypothetical protein GCM10010441_37560 [Kitasatospora paracochleata]|uniref:Uncharacterized protein n=1 Tax=Kitasatospora paracochleata TaxID=58354 RepID=A0ABT1J7A3_9ACTN|nr:hypothetical protein [Kitasatospora paracochleata]MCP2313317.1 hypothetical protein [Kitasatospora paracochleata]